MTQELNHKQQRFVAEYLVDLNGKQAAIRAGYSPRSAEVTASRMLGHAKVAAEIAKGQEKLAKVTGITAQMVIAELAKIGFANMADYMKVGADGDPFLDFSKVTRDQAAALSEVTVEDFKDGRGEDAREVRRVKFKMHDKRAALVDLGKHLGLFNEDPDGKRGGDTYNIVMNMPAPMPGEDRSYRNGPVIEQRPGTE